MNDLANVDTTTVSLQSGTTLIFDASTGKFEASQHDRWWDLLTILGENNGTVIQIKRNTGVSPYSLT